ncbi:ubiquinone-dependent pyruvate dehydrogenase [Pseudomonas segetis]|uniref:Pyruvate dehydrogenase [ubiquinone] n=1 Tax=Pseudomonas segetis TaxID=298908 RepID=A0A239HM72_9PSED|nr:ubiquinone-dependent pyruvate dehydrogenase [Pseudomonas segetis]SNS82422.1 pyruvate dehydrogenase (quinone) [Pseudomonas segetis]
MPKTVAEQFVETLVAAGIKRIYGVVGDSLNGLIDVVQRRGDIQWVHVRHEEVAAFAAGAEAHLTGSLAVCAGSCGPGNLHLINGLFDAHRSRVPVLAIAAQIPSAEIGSGYFQETHPHSYFSECSHYCELISSNVQMPRTLEIAIREAVGKRGVSVVVIPGDVAMQKAENAPLPGIDNLLPAMPVVTPAIKSLQQLADLLNSDRRITLLCGAGCAGAHKQVIALAERLQAPVVHTLRGKEHVAYDNEYSVGMTGLIGISSGYYAMLDCDVLLMLGTDFPYRQFYPRGKNVRIAQVDIRIENLGRRANLELGLVGDVRATLEALLPRLRRNTDSDHLRRAREHHDRNQHALADQAAITQRSRHIHPQQIVDTLSELASADAVFSCDVGLPTVWAARHLAMNGQRRLLGSFVHGSMANALAQAIGAQATYRDRQVISLSGDGGFTMLMGDFLTLAQLKLPVKVVVFNNGALGFVELEQKSSGILSVGTDLTNPDFASMARAIGIHGIRLEHPGQIRDGIAEALAHKGPVLIDAVVSRTELAMPPSITAQMAKGFSLYMLRAVMNGRADEIVDLAVGNWRR